MAAPWLPDPSEVTEGVERPTTHEVMALARISRATLWRRVLAGRLPPPIDQARQALFLKSAVMLALAVEPSRPHSAAVAAEQRLEALRRLRHKKMLDSGGAPK